MNFLSLIKEMFFPYGLKCFCCGKEIPFKGENAFCDNCAPAENSKFCLTCGRATANLSDYCNSCHNTPCFFDLARAPYCYNDEAAAEVVKNFKFRNQKHLAMFMANKMLACLKKEKWNVKAVTFAPMTKKKKKSRGFNQAEILAKKIAKSINAPLKEYLVKAPGLELKNLTKEERVTAVYSSVKINEKEEKDKTGAVLFVDDVFTTGATANECARLLKKKFAETVFVLTFATSKSIPMTV